MAGSGTKKLRIVDMAYIALFAALMAVCSWISIPATVPFTLQTFGVFCAVGLLGGKRGTIAVLVYILLGAVGLPVFSGFKGGFGCLLGTTGGYILGFLLSALVMWAMEKLPGRRGVILTLSMVAGLVVCYAFVHGCLCEEGGRNRSDDGAGLVCLPVHHSGSAEDCAGADHLQTACGGNPAAVRRAAYRNSICRRLTKR